SRQPNARVQRGRERHSENDERLASRPPLQRLVRCGSLGSYCYTFVLLRLTENYISPSSEFSLFRSLKRRAVSVTIRLYSFVSPADLLRASTSAFIASTTTLASS